MLWQHLGKNTCWLHAEAWHLLPAPAGEAALGSPLRVPSPAVPVVSSPAQGQGTPALLGAEWLLCSCQQPGWQRGLCPGAAVQMMALSLLTGVHLVPRVLPSASPPSHLPTDNPSGLGSSTKNWLGMKEGGETLLVLYIIFLLSLLPPSLAA